MEQLETTILLEGLRFGEGPRWHDGHLWLSDIRSNRVLRVAEDGSSEVMAETDGPSGLGWLPDGRLVISTLGRSSVLAVTDGVVTELHDLSAYGWSTNDMVVDRRGRIYVDVYRPKAHEGGMPPGDVLLATGDGVQVVARDLRTPNGMAVTPDGSTLLLSETFGGVIHAFTIRDDGTLCDQRIFADLGETRRPDGLCLDAEGAVWVGSFETEEFLRVLEGGEITHRIETPGFASVAPALGGADGRTLFLLVNDHRGLRGDGEPRSRIVYARVEVAGVGSP